MCSKTNVQKTCFFTNFKKQNTFPITHPTAFVFENVPQECIFWVFWVASGGGIARGGRSFLLTTTGCFLWWSHDVDDKKRKTSLKEAALL